jgi:hypothetical protein
VSADQIGGELIVSVGGTTIVATDVVLAHSQFLYAVQVEAMNWRARARRIGQLDLRAPLSVPETLPDLLHAESLLDQLQHRCGELADHLVNVAENYGYAEDVAQRIALSYGADLAHSLGQFLRSAFMFSPLAMLAVALPGLGLVGVIGGSKSGSGGIKINQLLLTNPTVVSLVRVAVSSVDDLEAGFLGTPRIVGRVLGDEGLGVIGVSRTALGVLAAARARGRFRETPVQVVRVGAPRRVTAPSGVADLAAGIPPAAAGQPQVRIERYGPAGKPSWVVYIGGTVDWSTVASSEPWDLTANVTAIAGQNAGSFAAVMAAMGSAGIASDDPVVLSGYSQGGLVATQVAAVGAFDVQAVATFGAPEASVPVPPGVATLTVEHTDDVVPATGGDSRVESDDRLTVRREAFATVRPPTDEDVPAHNLDRYQETAQLIDASPEENLQNFQDTVTGIVGSGAGEAVLWRGIRLPAGPAPK